MNQVRNGRIVTGAEPVKNFFEGVKRQHVGKGYAYCYQQKNPEPLPMKFSEN